MNNEKLFILEHTKYPVYTTYKHILLYFVLIICIISIVYVTYKFMKPVLFMYHINMYFYLLLIKSVISVTKKHVYLFIADKFCDVCHI